jgi:hypothetical protein
MRNRAGLTLLVFLILLLIILAQNGSLGNILGSIFNNTPIYIGATARPLVTNNPPPPTFNTAVPSNGIFPTPPAPTAYVPQSGYPPAYAPTYDAQATGSSNLSGTVPVGVVSSTGQCIVPTGWATYTIQTGDTLAAIATSYNLTVDQLAAANCLSNPNLIYEGQVIAVPSR